MNNLYSHSSKTKTEQTPKRSTVFYFSDLVRGFVKFWWLVLALVLIGAIGLSLKSIITYQPKYKVSATFTINSTDTYSELTSTDDKNFAKELSNTFPYILKTNILQNKICGDLGVTELPAVLSASSVNNTNMFTLSAKGYDPQATYDVLISAINNFPEIAIYTIGNIKLTMITEPEFPTKPTNEGEYKSKIFKGGFLGLIIGIIWIFAYMIFRETIRTPDDVKNNLGGEVIGTLPLVTFKKYSNTANTSLLINNPRIGANFLESMRLLKNTILHSVGKDKKVIMVTSTAPGEGKTTTCINIAISLAESSNRVLVIDGDIRNSGIRNLLKLDAQTGSNSYVINRLDGINISVLSFSREKSLYSMLSVENMKSIINSVRNDYDIILIDTPPCGLVSDAMVMAQVSDTALFVIMQDGVRTSKIKNAVSTLLSNGVDLLGYILNGTISGKFGNYGSYNYEYSYGKYKSEHKHFENK
ncbi:MAG: AAA family ATPase [Oscillospiraceae bacterium]|nr:AAA family ATPase [Candidatus Ruminococcus equi]